MRTLFTFIALVALGAPSFVSADEGACRELRTRGFETCFRQNDAARLECAEECNRCGEEITSCFSYCEHFCDSSYPEGCAFDLNACVSRCGHRCHEPGCDENPGCKQTWCAVATIKQCSDTCQASYGQLASCRSMWCGDGKARAACINSCNSTKAHADSCRKSWCGDGKSGQQCYRDADGAEENCRKQVESSVKACLAKK